MSSSYQLRFDANSAKQIERLVRSEKPAFKKRLEELLAALNENPFGTEASKQRFRIKKLASGEWSASPDYRHRVRYRVDENVVIIVEATKREDAYEGL
jgi:Txe/YoeB family toxin of Txe-Axe toxin-antitoxin module